MKSRFLGWTILALLLASLGGANTALQDEPIPAMRGPDHVDIESTRQIREYTTDPKYLTEWVDHVPASDTVPSPTKFLGHVIGAPNQLTRPEKIHDYFRALAAATDRVRVVSMGPTDLGREMILVLVADGDVLARLDSIVAANHELADPRVTTEARAVEISRSIPPLYWLTGGLHSPETGPPEMLMELAYRLAVSEQDHIKEIRSKVVTLITPVLEVDGRAHVVDWYYRFLTKVTDYQDMPPRMGPFWGKYSNHDNNRDGLQQSQLLTRNYTDAYYKYLPVVSLDLHESVPLIYISTGTGPYNEAVDPISVTEWQWMSSYDVSQLTKMGLQGVWSWGFYDGWYPGYLLWVTINHNATGRFYETFGNGHPGTWPRDLRNETYAEKRVNSRQWYRAWPPDQKIVWSLRNNTNYMQTGVLAALQLAARNGDTLLYNFWKKGQNSLERGRTEKPFAFRIPAKQTDRGALHHLLWLLSRHHIEVHEATAGAGLEKDMKIEEGDFIVRMDQPYRNFAKTLLMKAEYPKTAELPSYDDVAWSLDFMLGVDIQPVNDKAVFDVPVQPVPTVPELPGTVESGKHWLIEHHAQPSLATLRWKLPQARVRALAAEWEGHPAGSLIIDEVERKDLEAACVPLHLDAIEVKEDPDVPLVTVDLPRIALLHTWAYAQDSGWATYTMEQLAIPFTLINKDQLRAGGLRDKFDVILFPSQGGLSLTNLIHEIDSKWSPMPYTKTPEFPSMGDIDSTEDVTGGMGFEGLANLQAFVRGGGVLVALGSAGRIAADTGMARQATSSTPGGTPGSHLTAKVLRPEHPVVWGYPSLTWLFRGNLPLFNVRDHDRGMALVQFGAKTLKEFEKDADKKADIPVDEDLASAHAKSDPPTVDDEDDKDSKEKKGDKDKKDKDKDDEDQQDTGKSGKTDKPKDPPLLRSGQVKNADALETKPALLDVPVGAGHVLLYSWNPLHRYQNRHDFAFVTNALLFFNDFPAAYPSEDEMRAREAKPAEKSGTKSTGESKHRD